MTRAPDVSTDRSMVCVAAALLPIYGAMYAAFVPYAVFHSDEGNMLRWAMQVVRDPSVLGLFSPMGVTSVGMLHGALSTHLHAAALAIYPAPESVFALLILSHLVAHVLLFKIGSELGEPRAGIIASLFFATTPYFNVRFGLRIWNCSYIPVFVALLLWLAIRFARTSDWRLFVAAMFVQGLALQVHPTTVLFLPVTLLLFATTVPTISRSQYALGCAALYLGGAPYVVLGATQVPWLLALSAVALGLLPAIAKFTERLVRSPSVWLRIGLLLLGLGTVIAIASAPDAPAARPPVTSLSIVADAMKSLLAIFLPWSERLARSIGVESRWTWIPAELMFCVGFVVWGIVRTPSLTAPVRGLLLFTVVPTLTLWCVLALAPFRVRSSTQWNCFLIVPILVASGYGIACLQRRFPRIAMASTAAILLVNVASLVWIMGALARGEGLGFHGPTFSDKRHFVAHLLAMAPDARVDSAEVELLVLVSMAQAKREDARTIDGTQTVYLSIDGRGPSPEALLRQMETPGVQCATEIAGRLRALICDVAESSTDP